MQIKEIWSVSFERIREFFLAQSDVRQNGNARFFFGQCEIQITPLPLRQVGQFRFPQTQVEFSGPASDTEAIRQRFFLQFISAGG